MAGGVVAVEPAAATAARARRVVQLLGGRYSKEAGIDVDAGDAEVERWFLAATLFGTRISASIAQRTFRVLDGSGLVEIAHARDVPWGDLVAMLDAGGYARYDFRTASRLHALSETIVVRHGGEVAAIGRRHRTYPGLRDALDALPGWGPTTVELFLRELRGVWPGANPPLDDRAVAAASHLGLLDAAGEAEPLAVIAHVARAAGVDVRDLESGLVRLALAHRRDAATCPGGEGCVALSRREREGRDG